MYVQLFLKKKYRRVLEILSVGTLIIDRTKRLIIAEVPGQLNNYISVTFAGRSIEADLLRRYGKIV